MIQFVQTLETLCGYLDKVPMQFYMILCLKSAKNLSTEMTLVNQQ